MKINRRLSTTVLPICFSMLIALIVARPLRADDWPGWPGPNRDGICLENGLLKQWPHDGPKLVWKTTGLGIGYGGPAVVGNVLYIMGGQRRQGMGSWPGTCAGRQADLGLGRLARSILMAMVTPGHGRRPRSTAIASTPWASPATWCAWTSRTAASSGDRDLVKDFGGRIPHWGYRRVGVGGRAVVDLHARRCRRTPSLRLGKISGKLVGDRRSAIRPTTPR